MGAEEKLTERLHEALKSAARGKALVFGNPLSGETLIDGTFDLRLVARKMLQIEDLPR